VPFDPEKFPNIRPTNVSLSSASGADIKCYGEVDATIKIRKLRRSFDYTFIVADVTQPILGIDFITKYGLIIDCKNNCIYDPLTELNVPLQQSGSQSLSFSINLQHVDRRAHDILTKYPGLTSPLQLIDEPHSQVDHQVKHQIDTADHPPIYSKARPLTGDKLIAAKNDIQFLLNTGRVRRSNSPWASPLHLVPKKEPGQYRTCGDYRRLNNITVADKYPVPHLRTLTMSLHNKKVFSKIDLQQAYLQIPVAPEDIPKTAIITPFGLFEFLFTPYGMKNSGATFQRFIDSIFFNVPNVYCYIDDLLIASDNETQHLSDLENVLKALNDHNLKLNVKKCEFFKNSILFLGYQINAEVIRPRLNVSLLLMTILFQTTQLSYDNSWV